MNEMQVTKLRWTRAGDGALAGVCKGLAKALDIETWMLRVIWLIAILWFGTGVLLYLILWVSLPRVDRLDYALDGKILGVCARISQRLNVEIGIVRFIAIISLLCTFGASVLFYGLCYFLVPEVDKSVKSQ